LFEVYVAAFPHTGKAIDLGATTMIFLLRSFPEMQASTFTGASDSKQLHYILRRSVFSISLADRLNSLPINRIHFFKVLKKGISIGLKVKTDKPAGIIAFEHPGSLP